MVKDKGYYDFSINLLPDREIERGNYFFELKIHIVVQRS